MALAPEHGDRAVTVEAPDPPQPEIDADGLDHRPQHYSKDYWDLVFEQLSRRKLFKLGLAVAGTLLLLLPVTIFLLWSSWAYVDASWAIRENSREAGGLMYPFPSLMKTFIVVTALLLMVQGISILLRNSIVLFDNEPDAGRDQ